MLTLDNVVVVERRTDGMIVPIGTCSTPVPFPNVLILKEIQEVEYTEEGKSTVVTETHWHSFRFVRNVATGEAYMIPDEGSNCEHLTNFQPIPTGRH